MKKTISLLLASVILGLLPASAQIKLIDGQTRSAGELSQSLEQIATAGKVPGMYVCVFNENKPVYEEVYGFSNKDAGQYNKITTNFYGASLSKVVFSVLIMKLVELGKLDLDKPLQEYLPKPIYEYPQVTPHGWHEDYSSLRGDSLYKYVTARMCLSHTAGMPGWRFFTKDQKLHILLEPGTYYSYSGEDMTYLQVVLEKMWGQPLDSLMKKYVFAPAGMSNSAYRWLKEYERDYAVGHSKEGKSYGKDTDNAPRAASTLETTPEDLKNFISAVMQKKILTQCITDKMFSPQIRISSPAQFQENAFTDSTTNKDYQLSYGLGWGMFYTKYGWAVWKEGNGNGFQHLCLLFPEKGTGLLLLTNSDNGESIYTAVVEATLGKFPWPWAWCGFIPYDK